MKNDTKAVAVLVADDDEAIRAMLARVLARYGYRVVAVADGDSCIEEFRRGGYDVVISDIEMPGKRGPEVLVAVKAIDPEAEVILITGNATLDSAIDAVHGGAADYLRKPIEEVDYVVRVVARAVERRRLRAENRRLVGELQALNNDLEHRVHEKTEALRAAIEDLKVLDRMRYEFMTLVSHELRTPLSAVAGNADILAQGLVSGRADTGQAISAIQHNTGRLSRIVDDVALFLELSGGVAVVLADVDLGALVSEAAGAGARAVAEAKGLAFGLDYEPDVRVAAPRGLLRDALGRVLDNAVKFTSEGGVSVSVLRDGADGVVRVADTGVGIPPERACYVFQPLQIAGEIDNHEEGRGLGLAIARRVVTLAMGRISFTSPGHDRGTTFEIRIPLGFVKE